MFVYACVFVSVYENVKICHIPVYIFSYSEESVFLWIYDYTADNKSQS